MDADTANDFRTYGTLLRTYANPRFFIDERTTIAEQILDTIDERDYWYLGWDSRLRKHLWPDNHGAVPSNLNPWFAETIVQGIRDRFVQECDDIHHAFQVNSACYGERPGVAYYLWLEQQHGQDERRILQWLRLYLRANASCFRQRNFLQFVRNLGPAYDGLITTFVNGEQQIDAEDLIAARTDELPDVHAPLTPAQAQRFIDVLNGPPVLSGDLRSVTVARVLNDDLLLNPQDHIVPGSMRIGDTPLFDENGRPSFAMAERPNVVSQEQARLNSRRSVVLARVEDTFGMTPGDPSDFLGFEPRVTITQRPRPLEMLFSMRIEYDDFELGVLSALPRVGEHRVIADWDIGIERVETDRDIMRREWHVLFTLHIQRNDGLIATEADAGGVLDAWVQEVETRFSDFLRQARERQRNSNHGVVIQRNSGPPSHEAYAGAVYFDTMNSAIYLHDGEDWEFIMQGDYSSAQAYGRQRQDQIHAERERPVTMAGQMGVSLEQAASGFRRLGEAAAGVVKNVQEKMKDKAAMLAKARLFEEHKGQICIVRMNVQGVRKHGREFWINVAEIYDTVNKVPPDPAIWLAPVFQADINFIRNEARLNYNRPPSQSHWIWYDDVDFVRAVSFEEFKKEKNRREPKRRMVLKEE